MLKRGNTFELQVADADGFNPQAVLIAIEQSGRLGALNSRVCRPLDKPLIPKRDNEEQRTYDFSAKRTTADYQPSMLQTSGRALTPSCARTSILFMARSGLTARMG
ncbi:MAG: hypothetical protein HC794_10860 [Nitrospiraceae bacterium]|nr:hypothetical protein [Nitrospiraceae bacterium]